MKNQAEKLTDQCRWFTGLANIYCRAGIQYTSVRYKGSDSYQYPCFRGEDGFCEKASFPTPEEVISK